MKSPEFLRAFPEAKKKFDASRLGAKQGGRKSWWDILETIPKAGGNRDVVYRIGKFFGHKFRPWGAVKAGAKVAKFGVVLAAVGVGLDVVDWVRSAKAAKKREDARREAATFLRESREEVRKSVLGGESDSQGPCAYLAGHVSELTKMYDEVHRSAIDEERKGQILLKELRLLDGIIADARTKLGLPDREEAQDG